MRKRNRKTLGSERALGTSKQGRSAKRDLGMGESRGLDSKAGPGDGNSPGLGCKEPGDEGRAEARGAKRDP